MIAPLTDDSSAAPPLAVNRSVQSHVAGGLVLNAGAGYAVQRRLWEARFRRAWVERGGASNT